MEHVSGYSISLTLGGFSARASILGSAARAAKESARESADYAGALEAQVPAQASARHRNRRAAKSPG